MKLRKALLTAITGCMLAFGGQAIAQVNCALITTILQWETAGSCVQGDKLWTLNSDTLADSVQVLFSTPVPTTHVMQLVGFDNSDAPGTWNLNYTITVLDPVFFINAMFAGADDSGGLGSTLIKQVTGDETFNLFVTNGVEGPLAQKLGIHALTLTVNETFHADAGTDLLSVSDTFRQGQVALPLPGTLALLGLGLVALGAVRRTRS